MMTIEEIRAGKEGQTFDLKSIQIDPKALAIPIVAMANADGGMLAIGISDKTRKIEGVNQHTAQGGLSVAGGCRCLTKELDMIAC